MTAVRRRQRGTAAENIAGEMRRHQFVTLLEHSPDATAILDADGRISEWNPAAETLLGWSRPEVLETPARRLLPEEHGARFDAVWAYLAAGRVLPPPLTSWLHHDGSWVAISTHVAPIQADGDFAGAVVILRDPAEESARASAARAPGVTGAARSPGRGDPLGATGAATRLGVLERDELTGLPGRRRLQRRLAAPVAAGLARGVAVLDVDAFALVNEAYGPEAGDEVLSELGRRLRAVAGTAVLGRWQADSFVWIVDADDPASVLAELGARVAAVLDEPFRVGADEVRLTVSTGMVTSALARGADLLAAALDALRAAKNSGRDRVVWYTEALRTSSTGAFRLASDLRQGIERDELRLHFQPIVSLATGGVVGVEALVRWQRPGVGLLSPASFIDVAERTGQVVPLGAWVARHACLAAARLHRLGNGPRSVSINLSARQLSDPGLVEMLRAALADSGCPPESIIVEVTETALMYDLAAATSALEAIKALGVGLDLDDFGTGYSSLLYLKHFPVDRIKIDGSFVAGLGSDYADTAIVASTIALAHSIGIEAVAEGVETADQFALLRRMGCDFAQGYLLGRPLGLDRLNEWLERHVPAGAEPELTGAEAGAGFAGLVPPTAGPGAGTAERRADAADLRDGLADARDRLADVRDRLADARDDAAAERDRRADARDDVGPAGAAG